MGAEKEAKTAAKKKQEKQDKKAEEAAKKEAEEKERQREAKKLRKENKVFAPMSKQYLKKALKTQELDTKGSKEQLIERIKNNGIDVDKVTGEAEKAEIEKVEKAKEKAQK